MSTGGFTRGKYNIENDLHVVIDIVHQTAINSLTAAQPRPDPRDRLQDSHKPRSVDRSLYYRTCWRDRSVLLIS